MLVSSQNVVNLQGDKNWSNVKSHVQMSSKQARRRIEFKVATVKSMSISNNKNVEVPNGVTRKPDVGIKPKIKDTSRGLFEPGLVDQYLSWKKVSRVGPGFFNDGNTCYLNSTLQCLMYVPALTQTFRNESALVLKNLQRITSNQQHQQGHHSKTILQHFQSLVEEVATSPSGKTVSPRSMVSNIRRVGKQFKPLRQEDAHEYLRQLLDCMHEEVLKANGVKVSDGKIAETTVISRIFGGYLCNTVSCPKCSFASRTQNHFQDVSLDITQGISSVGAALDFFTKAEYLTSGNEWRCDQCKARVRAKKQMTFAQLPNVLVLHLKRFSYGNSKGKNVKQIDFGPTLSVACTGEGGEVRKVKYDLHGVVVHHGHSTHSGHYIAFIKASNGQWHEMNDSRVTVVPLQRVLACQAYILFYSKAVAPTQQQTATPAAQPAAPKVSAPVNSNDVGEVVPVPKAVAKVSVLPPATQQASVAAVSSKPSSGPVVKAGAESESDDSDLEVDEEEDEDEADDSDYVEEEGAEDTGSLLDILAQKMGNSSGGNRLAHRLKRSHFQSPFRFCGPSEQLTRWSWRNKRNIRELGAMMKAQRMAGRTADGQATATSVGSDNESTAIDAAATSATKTQSKQAVFEASEPAPRTSEMPISDNGVAEKRELEVPFVRKNKNVVINESNAAAAGRNSGEVMRALIAQSNRGRETGGEGMWDSVSAELGESVKAFGVKQRRDEQREKNARRPDLWSQKLDEGRVKKVKINSGVDAFRNEDGAPKPNQFQEVQNNRGGDREAYFQAGAGQFEKKRRNFSNDSGSGAHVKRSKY